MADLTDVITAAVAEASGAADEGGAADVEAVEVGTDAEASVEAATEPAADTTDAPVDDKKLEATDDLTKELEELGLSAPKEGQRENRLPYSRVKKIVENARKKLTEAHQAELTTREQRLKEVQERIDAYAKIDQLMSTNPAEYIRTLAQVNPQYRRFLAAVNKPQKEQAPPQANDPMPQPDAQFPDGSVGYSQAGLSKLLEWQARQVEARVTDRVEKTYAERFGPIEQTYKARQAYEAQLPKVRGQIQQARETWGELFDADYKKNEQSEILQYMKANPAVPFEAAVAKVLIPKLQAQKNKVREEVVREMNERAKAAARTPVAPAKAAADGDTVRSTEDVIRDAIKGLR